MAAPADDSPADASPLPVPLARWFAERGWTLRAHQRAMIAAAAAGEDALLVAPTGSGKTLAGFLPALLDLAATPPAGAGGGVRALYLSPLKALAVDVARNLDGPIAALGGTIRAETRTGDTPATRRTRQMRSPPDLLLTTPEQLALMIAQPEAARFFAGLRFVIVDEAHALAPTKRGDLLALGLARLRGLAPDARVSGLSATVADPAHLCRWLGGSARPARLVEAPAASAARPQITILDSAERLPWAGHSARHAMAEIYAALARSRLALVFVNTRMQAELVFQLLWAINDDNRRIALHHGSLDVGQRRKVEAAMAAGGLDAVVATSTLDLGIDWGDVDLVIHVGAPKGASRLLQRIGRANHRLDDPSRAILVPANRFEVLECVAAREAALAGEQDAETSRSGALDALAQHLIGRVLSEPASADELYAEIRAAAPYADLPRATFDRVLGFVRDGGYALRAYERFARLSEGADGRLRVASRDVARAYRMNVGTIVEAAMLKVHLGRIGRKGAPGAAALRVGRLLGEIEEGFVEGLVPGDSFAFAGEVLRFEGLFEDKVLCAKSAARDPKIPAYAGGKFPLSTHLSARVRAMLADPPRVPGLPQGVRDWLDLQARHSALPGRDDLLIESFPKEGRHFLVLYPFEGRLAHQTLGMLLTRRLERDGLRPLGFVANDYALAIWMLDDPGRQAAQDSRFFDTLLAADMLGDDLEAWLDESALMKRSFRTVAVVAGLIERNLPGHRKRAKAVTISTDLLYDVLRRHEPDHVLLLAARQEASRNLLDLARLSQMLSRIEGRIRHQALARVSPLAVPILLEIGREPVFGEARDAAIAEAATALLEEIGTP